MSYFKNLKFWKKEKPKQLKTQENIEHIIDCATTYNQIIKECEEILPSLDGFFSKNHTKMNELDWQKVEGFVNSKKTNKAKSQERSIA